MVQYFPYLLLLMVAIMLLIMLANRLKVAYPILLVLGGLAISLIPNVPTITLNPDLVLIIFLPPLLYADVFSLSLKEMWKWRRIIFSFAFIVVFITAAVVAWVANMVFPGFSLALGFLLGGVDIVLSHSPLEGIHDVDDGVHNGFKVFHKVIKYFKPKLWVHGHIHLSNFMNYQDTEVEKTVVSNTFGYRIFTIEK